MICFTLIFVKKGEDEKDEVGEAAIAGGGGTKQWRGGERGEDERKEARGKRDGEDESDERQLKSLWRVIHKTPNNFLNRF